MVLDSLANYLLSSAGIVPISSICPFGPFCISLIFVTLKHSVSDNLDVLISHYSNQLFCFCVFGILKIPS
jgi:hypothetical protein